MAVVKLSTPGVYVQEIPSLPPSVAEVATAIPAFVGYTEKADKIAPGDLLLIPTKISGMAEFITLYGGPPIETADSIKIGVTDAGGSQYSIKFDYDDSKRSPFKLYYSLQSFFDNGGGTCFIVAAGNYVTGGAAATISDSDLTTGLDKAKDVDEVTLLVVPEMAATGSAASYTKVVQKMISQAADPDLRDRFAIIDPYKVTPLSKTYTDGDLDADIQYIRDATVGPESDRYAAAYYPSVVSSYAHQYDFDNLTIDSYSLAAGATASLTVAVGDKMSKFSGSVFYNKVKDALGNEWVVLPPSGAVAGVYTRVDNTKGVWKAPANEAVLSVVSPVVNLSSRQQEDLNVDPVSGKSVNVIRSFPGFGTLVWGARTLNGNDNEWRYVSVRRFFIMVEESIKKSIQWAVFEPNAIGTWVKVSAMIENYLYKKWQEGALAGAKADQAYYVHVGLGSTMNATDVLEGRMNVEIGMAVVRPAEFIVLKFTQMVQQS
ncbi:MAG: phage tail sheath family protein [Niabella sp.]|nr:phage tail sheath family protein [Niabella sp.]